MPTETTLPSLSLPIPSMVGFLLSVLLFPPYINWLRNKQIGQFIREEGPASHTGKARTPTMGGLVFMAVTLLSSLTFLSVAGNLDAGAIIALAAALFCGLIGLIDDTAKFRRKANAGISARARLLTEFALGLGLTLAAVSFGEGTRVIVPTFSGGEPACAVMIPWWLFAPSAAFMLAASANALNLHDGMDGLAAGTSMQVLAALALVLSGTGQWALAAVAAAAAGAVSGFLLFNKYPARIFMGDTGSLFLGGLMGALALVGGVEVWFVPLAIVYILETVSVMVQVVYFKLTKDYKPETPMGTLSLVWLKLTKRLPGEGKRFFRMAPLHHHFEAVGAERGVAEWQVVLAFWLAQLCICLSVLALMRTG